MYNVRSDLKVTNIKTNIDKIDGIEDIWISIQRKKLPSFIIGCVYRHPKAPILSFEYLKNVFKEICLKKKPVFILGDMNDDFLLPNCKLQRIVSQLNMKQLITKPTRITSSSSTLIDAIITNNVKMVCHIDVAPCPIADHELITLQINIAKPKRVLNTKTFRSLSDYSPDNLCGILMQKAPIFNHIMQTDNVDIQLDIFTKNFNTSLDECAPYITKEITRPPAPWISNELKSAIKLRDQLQNQSKADRGNELLQCQYKIEKKNVRAMIQGKKNEHFKKEFDSCQGNISERWNIVHSVIPQNNKNDNLSSYDNEIEKAVE